MWGSFFIRAPISVIGGILSMLLWCLSTWLRSFQSKCTSCDITIQQFHIALILYISPKYTSATCKPTDNPLYSLTNSQIPRGINLFSLSLFAELKLPIKLQEPTIMTWGSLELTSLPFPPLTHVSHCCSLPVLLRRYVFKTKLKIKNITVCFLVDWLQTVILALHC